MGAQTTTTGNSEPASELKVLKGPNGEIVIQRDIWNELVHRIDLRLTSFPKSGSGAVSVYSSEGKPPESGSIEYSDPFNDDGSLPLRIDCGNSTVDLGGVRLSVYKIELSDTKRHNFLRGVLCGEMDRLAIYSEGGVAAKMPEDIEDLRDMSYPEFTAVHTKKVWSFLLQEQVPQWKSLDLKFTMVPHEPYD